jgi:hypothetical protein
MVEDKYCNSNKMKEEAKLAEMEKARKKVISAPAKARKKSELEKAAEAMIAKDARDVGSYILMDVIVPKLTDMIISIVTDGVNIIFKGKPAARKSRDGYTNYSGSYRGDRSYGSSDRDEDYRSRGVGRMSYKDIVYETKADALNVLQEMQDIIDAYGEVTVAALFEISEITDNHTDNKYGWTDLGYAEPVRVDGGYGLRLPRPRPLD